MVAFFIMEKIYNIAKEKGYSGEESLEHLQSWIRKNYHLHPEIYFSKFHKVWSVNNFFINIKKGKSIAWKEFKENKSDTYEESLELALRELLKIIK